MMADRYGAEFGLMQRSAASKGLRTDGWCMSMEPRLRGLDVSSWPWLPGLTSLPNLPSCTRSHDWTAPVLHHGDFGVHSSSILATSSDYKNITILGGGKSAADMVYGSIKAGKSVDWIIRRTGEGPGIFMNPAATGRCKNNAEAGAT